MNKNNDPFKIYNPVFDILREQQESWQRIIQPSLNASRLAISALPDYQSIFKSINPVIPSITAAACKLHTESFSDVFKVTSTFKDAFKLGSFIDYKPISSIAAITSASLKSTLRDATSLGTDWGCITKLGENFSRIAFMDLAISKYPNFEKDTLQKYSDIVLDIAEETCSLYDQFEDDNIDEIYEEIDFDFIAKMEKQTKEIEKEILALKLKPAGNWLARNISKIYFIGDSIPHENRMIFYEWLARLPLHLIELGADNFFDIIIKITLLYLAFDNEKLRKFIKDK